MIRRLQNKVAESRYSLTAMSIYAIVAWLLMGIVSNQQLWPCFGIFIVSTYLMVELNNRNSLLRTYSRMVSCSFIALYMMLPVLYQSFEIPLFQIGIILFYTFSFKTYQSHDRPGTTYTAFIFVGLISIIWPPVLYAIPILWIICGALFLSMDVKNLLASIFAVLTPYWCLLPYLIYEDRFGDIVTHFERLIPNHDIINLFSDPESIMTYEWDVGALPFYTPFVLLMIIALTGITHYLRKSFQDKIQTRMYYHSFVTLAIVCLIMMTIVILLPFDNAMHLPYLTSMLIVCTAPLIGHYITFTNTHLTNISFVIFFIIIILTTLSQSQFIQPILTTMFHSVNFLNF